jgi:cytochrome c
VRREGSSLVRPIEIARRRSRGRRVRRPFRRLDPVRRWPRSTPASEKELFDKRCGGCHALDRDKEGQQLHGVYSRKAACVESFQYSDALKQSKIVWTDETLERWLTDTEKLVPNNDMTVRVEKPDERRAIIAYLRHDSGK